MWYHSWLHTFDFNCMILAVLTEAPISSTTGRTFGTFGLRMGNVVSSTFHVTAVQLARSPHSLFVFFIVSFLARCSLFFSWPSILRPNPTAFKYAATTDLPLGRPPTSPPLSSRHSILSAPPSFHFFRPPRHAQRTCRWTPDRPRIDKTPTWYCQRAVSLCSAAAPGTGSRRDRERVHPVGQFVSDGWNE